MQFHFDRITHVLTADEYLDQAFGRAKKESEKSRGSFSGSKKLDRIQKSHIVECTRLETVHGTLSKILETIGRSFPSIDSLPTFYQELVKLTMDYPQLKKSLGAINWARQQETLLFLDYRKRISRCRDLEGMNKLRRDYYGRVSSVFKQIKDDLHYLSHCKRVFKDFPNVQDDTFTVAIAGFPNVGKSTLLRSMTTSKPEVNAYPFTTKQILIGQIKRLHKSIQVLDTPGTLNRIERMNNIEKQAHLAMKYCADLIIYVFDLTLEYPLKDQEKLYASTRRLGKEVIVYFSKTDLVPPQEIMAYKATLPSTVICVTDGPEALKEYLMKRIMDSAPKKMMPKPTTPEEEEQPSP